jgi:hypothetical protein
VECDRIVEIARGRTLSLMVLEDNPELPSAAERLELAAAGHQGDHRLVNAPAVGEPKLQ